MKRRAAAASPCRRPPSCSIRARFRPGRRDGNKIEQRIVKVGLTAGDLIEVKDGLEEGDVVVTRAGTFLRDGDVVRPVVPEAKLSEAQ